MTSYMKSISKIKEADEKDKSLPVAYLGSTMVSHGEDFDKDSEFGACLISESWKVGLGPFEREPSP